MIASTVKWASFLVLIGMSCVGCSASGAAVGGLTVGAVLNRTDRLVQDAIETTDSRVAREQGILFAGVDGTINRLREAYAGELDRTFISLSKLEQSAFRDLDQSIARLGDLVDSSLDARIAQMQGAMNQVLGRIPFTRKDPVILTVTANRNAQSSGAPDVVIYGYFLGNDLSKELRPTIRINDFQIDASRVTVDNDRVNIRLEPATRDQILLLFSPCSAEKEIKVAGTFRWKATSGFLGLGSSIRKAELDRLIVFPESYHAKLTVDYAPVTARSEGSPIPFDYQTPCATKAHNPGISGSSTAEGTLSYNLPSDARNISITEYGWRHLDGSTRSGEVRRSTDAPVIALVNITLKGRLEKRGRYSGGVWAHLFVTGTYTRPQTTSTNVPTLSREPGAFINRRIESSVVSDVDANAVPKHVRVELFREGCDEVADQADIAITTDGSGTENSKNGLFSVIVKGGLATIILQPK